MLLRRGWERPAITPSPPLLRLHPSFARRMRPLLPTPGELLRTSGPLLRLTVLIGLIGAAVTRGASLDLIPVPEPLSQDLEGPAEGSSHSDSEAFHFRRSLLSANSTPRCKSPARDVETPLVWEPQPGKYLLMFCFRNQVSDASSTNIRRQHSAEA